MNIKENFENLTNKDIVLLYLIVIMIYSLIFIYYKDFLKLIYPNIAQKTVINRDNTNNKIESKRLSDLELVTYINRNTKDFQIFLEEIKISQNVCDIKLRGDYLEIINFLLKVSQNLKIIQFDMQKIDNTIVVFLRLGKKKFFSLHQEYSRIEKLGNPFYYEKMKKVIPPPSIKISAIVDFEILVNNKWYVKGDMINQYKVLKIRKNKVDLLNTINNNKITQSINYE